MNLRQRHIKTNDWDSFDDSDLTNEEREVVERLFTLRTLKPSTPFQQMTLVRLQKHMAETNAIEAQIADPEILPESQEIARELAAFHNVTPSAQTRRKIRANVQMRIAQTPTLRSTNGHVPLAQVPRLKKVPRPLMQFATMAIAFFLVLLVGVSLATARSMPGDNFYPIKRGIEDIHVSLTPPEKRPALNIKLTDRRLNELDQLVTNKADKQQVIAAAVEYNKSVEQTINSVVDDQTTNPDIVGLAESTLNTHSEMIATLVTKAPPEARTAIDGVQKSQQQAQKKVQLQAQKPSITPSPTATKTPIGTPIAMTRPTLRVLIPVIRYPKSTAPSLNQAQDTSATAEKPDDDESNKQDPTPTNKASATPTAEATATNTATPSNTPEMAGTPLLSNTTTTQLPTPTATSTPLPTATSTPLPTNTPSPTPTNTPSPTPTVIPTATPNPLVIITDLLTQTPTVIASPTITTTKTITDTGTITDTNPIVTDPVTDTGTVTDTNPIDTQPITDTGTFTDTGNVSESEKTQEPVVVDTTPIITPTTSEKPTATKEAEQDPTATRESVSSPGKSGIQPTTKTKNPASSSNGNIINPGSLIKTSVITTPPVINDETKGNPQKPEYTAPTIEIKTTNQTSETKSQRQPSPIVNELPNQTRLPTTTPYPPNSTILPNDQPIIAPQAIETQ